MTLLARRSLLLGLASAIAAPAVIRTPGLLMPVGAVPVALNPVWPDTFERFERQLLEQLARAYGLCARALTSERPCFLVMGGEIRRVVA